MIRGMVCARVVSSLSKAAKARANRPRSACLATRCATCARSRGHARARRHAVGGEIACGLILAGKARDFGAMGEALLFSAARIDHIDRLIRPALSRGAYRALRPFRQFDPRLSGREAAARKTALLATLEQVALAGVKPDLTFLLDLPPETGMERARKRRGEADVDRFEGRGPGLPRAIAREISGNRPRRTQALPRDRRRPGRPKRSPTPYGRRLPKEILSARPRSNGREGGDNAPPESDPFPPGAASARHF